MIKTVNISNMKLNGCGQSVRREIEAMHDDYLEKGGSVIEVQSKNKESNFLKYLFFLNKVLLRKNKGSK